MTSMDGDVVDMANIKPMLDRTTKIQRQVNGVLQWRVIVYDGALGKQVERLAVGLPDARRLRDVLRANVAAGRPGNPPALAASLAKPGQRQAGARVEALTVNQWAPLFLRYYAVTRDGSPRPATSMESATQRLERYILPFIGDRTMESLTLAELEDMIANLRKINGDPLAQSSKESVSSTLKTVWTLAKRRGVINANVAADLPTSWGGAAASSRRLNKPSLTAVDALAEAMGELGDVVLLLACTGMRWEEASGAWTSDVDLDKRLLSCQRVSPVVRGRRVPPGTTMKSRHARRDILIVDQVVEPLQRLLARAGSASGVEPVLMTGQRGRGPLHYPHVAHQAQPGAGRDWRGLHGTPVEARLREHLDRLRHGGRQDRPVHGPLKRALHPSPVRPLVPGGQPSRRRPVVGSHRCHPSARVSDSPGP